MPRLTNRLTHNGQTDTVSGWAIRLGISKSAIYQRLQLGWTMEEVCASKRTHRSARRVKTAAPTQAPTTVRQVALTTPIASLHLDELKRMDLVLQREVTRALRQFNRDIHAIMSRGVDRDFLGWPVDRSIPVARGLPEIGNS
jgi:hypothetical protein